MKRLALLLLAALFGATASDAATLRGDVMVTAGIVTIGDMFIDAGDLATVPLFLAPAPGTIGIVPLDAVRQAASLAGLADFDPAGLTRVRVARAATIIDSAALGDLIGAELLRRGILSGDMRAETHFEIANLSFNAEAIDPPASLTDLRYQPQTGAFTARFLIAGIDQPIDVGGSIDLMVPAPRLLASLPAGTVLTDADFETAMVPEITANAGSYADLDQLIGQQLQRQSRIGMMLKLSDVGEPTVVTRNTLVMVTLKTSGMTLTVKGQALTTAAAGEPVDVLNTITRKILHGIARPDGTVEILSSITVAGL